METINDILCTEEVKNFIANSTECFDIHAVDILINSYCHCLDRLFEDTVTFVQDVLFRINEDKTVTLDVECEIYGDTEYLVVFTDLLKRCIRFGVKKGTSSSGSIILSFTFPKITK